MIGNTILALGHRGAEARTTSRKLLSGEHVWCQGFSEPNAGSDLAGLGLQGHPRRRRVGDQRPEDLDHLRPPRQPHLPAGRAPTPTAPRHKGITFLLVPMDQPGVEVRPIKMMSGDSEFNEVFFTDARCPKEHVLGEVNGGWAVAMTLLGFERGEAAAVRADPLPRGARPAGRARPGDRRRRRPGHPPAARRLLRAGRDHAVPRACARSRRSSPATSPGPTRRSPSCTGPSTTRSSPSSRSTSSAPRRWCPTGAGRRTRSRPTTPARPTTRASWVGTLLRGARRHDLRRHVAGAAQHHRRAHPRPAQGAGVTAAIVVVAPRSSARSGRPVAVGDRGRARCSAWRGRGGGVDRRSSRCPIAEYLRFRMITAYGDPDRDARAARTSSPTCTGAGPGPTCGVTHCAAPRPDPICRCGDRSVGAHGTEAVRDVILAELDRARRRDGLGRVPDAVDLRLLRRDHRHRRGVARRGGRW